MIRVAIIGAAGYTAVESINILLRHGAFQITYLTAQTEGHGRICDVFPSLTGRLDLPVELVDLNKLIDKADVALCCLPHKASMQFVPQMLNAGLKVVDFSADYRLHDIALYEKVYQTPHTDPNNVAQAAFGLPELFRSKIPGSKLVANPGCYPTAASLALAPLLTKKLIAPNDIIINAVSGISGAGRKPSQNYHFPEMNENFFAYSVGTHRHQPEIEQILSEKSGTPVAVLFQSHVAPIDRGIVESIYCRPTEKVTPEQLTSLYREFYNGEPFVRLVGKPPGAKQVAFTNFCDIFPTVVRDKIVLFSAIDNLIKGAAGQAIQNLNIICSLPETQGLL